MMSTSTFLGVNTCQNSIKAYNNCITSKTSAGKLAWFTPIHKASCLASLQVSTPFVCSHGRFATTACPPRLGDLVAREVVLKELQTVVPPGHFPSGLERCVIFVVKLEDFIQYTICKSSWAQLGRRFFVGGSLAEVLESGESRENTSFFCVKNTSTSLRADLFQNLLAYSNMNRFYQTGHLQTGLCSFHQVNWCAQDDSECTDGYASTCQD